MLWHCSRSSYVSWYLPHSFHNPMAAAEPCSCHRLSPPRNGYRSGSLVRIGKGPLRWYHCRNHGSNSTLRLRYCRLLLLATSIRHHPLALQPPRLWLGGFQEREIGIRSPRWGPWPGHQTRAGWKSLRPRVPTSSQAMGTNCSLLEYCHLCRTLGAVALAYVCLQIHLYEDFLSGLARDCYHMDLGYSPCWRLLPSDWWASTVHCNLQKSAVWERATAECRCVSRRIKRWRSDADGKGRRWAEVNLEDVWIPELRFYTLSSLRDHFRDRPFMAVCRVGLMGIILILLSVLFGTTGYLAQFRIASWPAKCLFSSARMSDVAEVRRWMRI